ncbi:N-acetylglucosamine-1-phosphodiester alpha-N-acetylglucosaminidase isoform X2 [Betta splendens]|uniref:N-acetylglucosamine-1-phosphodiester alpha-N-acetylglucosaminidase isoform X2 n=1 Tax=Betta splendens TaxID=158456 RepID=A0A9W2XBA3_BETSP|nr:N-acetylglucosamine-1-phosphodiester alpha-N-acetylglucosaminidase isoform X2 [Betta splendens]
MGSRSVMEPPKQRKQSEEYCCVKRGHMTVVHDPLRTVSVLEPGGPGGCGMNQRSTVKETARTAGCLYAQNAGFFRTQSGHCLGNVVSDGRRVQDSGGVQNAQFGIRRDGTLVFGYLSQDDVLDQSNPFVQLVSGVVWLLRDGEVYINQSLKAECDETQETGHFHNFVDVVSARTAVGHDADGNLLLFQIDGKTSVRGMNLWEFAEFMKQSGAINAINLDGGGSSTFVVDGSLASYPSDHCDNDERWCCERRVSTILCVHPRRCQPSNCSGNGDCIDGRCQCRQGWQGVGCEARVCLPPVCGPRGICTASGCVCHAGWRGHNCNQVCPLGFFGLSCTQQCRCDDPCLCDPQTGSCNATLPEETNLTLHTAGQCLAKQMFTLWRREEEARREPPHLTERTWLILILSLTLLLAASLLLHLERGCRGSLAVRFPKHRDYSYLPLTDRAAACAGGDTETPRRRHDSDSQDEVWSQTRSGSSEL